MDFRNFKKLNLGGIDLKQLFIGADQVWKAGYKNWVRYSTESDGKTIYNGGLGYKNGYRIRSGGVEGAQRDAACTGFMPFKKGDIMYNYPAFHGGNVDNAINFANASFENIGQMTASGALYGICAKGSGWAASLQNVSGVSVLDVSGASNANDIAYVRITNSINAGANGAGVTTGAQFIVTINEEIA